MSKKIGVVLSGSGVYDGSEIHETVCALLSLEKHGLEAVCIAPDEDQLHVINHITGEPTEEKRNILTESARIARGKITSCSDINSQDLDGLFFPGGFGAAKNLCDFAVSGVDCKINPEIEKLVNEMIENKKPIAAVCIAPALIARIASNKGIKIQVTIGTDEDTATGIEEMGASHKRCNINEITVDAENKIISGPAYMEAKNISEVASNVEQVVAELKKMI